MKFVYAALLSIFLIGVFVFTVAGSLGLLGMGGIAPEIALLGVIFCALVGAWASIAIEGEEALFHF